jgi:hypothetical protein
VARIEISKSSDHHRIMRVSYITTVSHNVGDDFVREGILFLIKKIFGETSNSFIHKHIPVTARPEMEWYYNSGLSKLLDKMPRARGMYWSKILDILPLNPKTDKILTTDLLVQSGAPVYWKGAQNNEWYDPIIRRRFMKMVNRPPFINIGVGTCLPYNSLGEEILSSPECISYIKKLHAISNVTTLRDSISRSILNQIGLDAPVMPCPSIFARDNLGISSHDPEYVVLNFMRLGGHYDFAQNIDRLKWNKIFLSFYNAVKGHSPIIFSCHNEQEYYLVTNLFPDAKCFIGKTAGDYLDFYSRAKFFVGCRVHGAFATASFGRPAFVIGNDTRASMVKEIGLDHIFVKEIDSESLVDAYHMTNDKFEKYSSEFINIRNRALADYLKAILPVRELIHTKIKVLAK